MLRRVWRRLRPRDLVVWITPELSLGPRFDTDEAETLARQGVGAVIDVRSEACDDEAALARHGLRLLHMAVDDHRPPTQEQLQQATEWALAEIAAGRRIYVHCRSGIGRSPTIATAVLVAIGYPLGEAYQAVKNRRPWATLSEEQWEALEQFSANCGQAPPTAYEPSV